LNLNVCPLFDSHFHIIDPRFPLTPNQGYLPDAFTCQDYLSQMSGYDLQGGAIVSGSFQAFDQTYLLDALQTLGPGFVGVTQVPQTISDDEVLKLGQARVRALRFNLKRGGSEDVRHLDSLARRVHELSGWHTELYVDSRELDAKLLKTLIALPSVCIDHLGLSREGLPSMLRLAQQGVRVKATGFGRVDFDVAAALRDFHTANPGALVFGSDLPSTRAPRPYSNQDFQLVVETLGEKAARAVFWDNAARLYGVT
jgi:predicted TIM-barrel fold metal-dependent hydrolase